MILGILLNIIKGYCSLWGPLSCVPVTGEAVRDDEPCSHARAARGLFGISVAVA